MYICNMANSVIFSTTSHIEIKTICFTGCLLFHIWMNDTTKKVSAALGQSWYKDSLISIGIAIRKKRWSLDTMVDSLIFIMSILFLERQLLYWSGAQESLKTKWQQKQFDNFVITRGTVSCHIDNLQCHQWWDNCQIDDFLFSVNS